MKYLVILVLLPSFTGSVHTEGWVDWDDFVIRVAIYCKKFSDTPFTGKVTRSFQEPLAMQGFFIALTDQTYSL